jgi:dihydrolipoamide dehydrogenase
VSDGAGAGDYGAKNIIIATGSVPRVIPNITIDGKHFVTSDEILTLKQPPKSLLVMGAGAVGVEFASVFSRFGSTCTIIEMQDRLVPIEDREVSAEFAKLLQKRGIGVRTSTKLKSATVKNKTIHATLTGADGKDEVVQAEMMLVAIGRAPRTDDLGLETINIERDTGGFLAVDGLMRTATPNVYAIGDVVRTPWLAHVASSEGILAVDHMAGQPAKPINYKLTPGCTYSSPEIGSVGLTEAAAKEAGYDVKVGKFPFSAVAKARISGDTEGFVKIVSDKRYDEILGVHIIGPHATDLIAEACVALRLECTTEELANIMHAHPSLSESIVEAAHATLGHAMHL